LPPNAIRCFDWQAKHLSRRHQARHNDRGLCFYSRDRFEEQAVNFDDNFRRIGSANVEPIKAAIADIENERWESEASQAKPYEAHRDTQSIPLVHDSDYRHTEPTRRLALKTFEPVIRPILGITADYYDESPKGKALREKFGIGYFIRANFVRLLPGDTIAEHRDLNFSMTHAHRVHVPIITNDKVWFTVGG